MPPFPERESSILAKLKKKKPAVPEGTEAKEKEPRTIPQAQINNLETTAAPPQPPPPVLQV